MPVVALFGLRQVGITRLTRALDVGKRVHYLDLKRQSDVAKLADPELYLRPLPISWLFSMRCSEFLSISRSYAASSMKVVAPGNEMRILWRRVLFPQNCCGGVPFSLLGLGLGGGAAMRASAYSR